MKAARRDALGPGHSREVLRPGSAHHLGYWSDDVRPRPRRWPRGGCRSPPVSALGSRTGRRRSSCTGRRPALKCAPPPAYALDRAFVGLWCRRVQHDSHGMPAAPAYRASPAGGCDLLGGVGAVLDSLLDGAACDTQAQADVHFIPRVTASYGPAAGWVDTWMTWCKRPTNKGG